MEFSVVRTTFYAPWLLQQRFSWIVRKVDIFCTLTTFLCLDHFSLAPWILWHFLIGVRYSESWNLWFHPKIGVLGCKDDILCSLTSAATKPEVGSVKPTCMRFDAQFLQRPIFCLFHIFLFLLFWTFTLNSWAVWIGFCVSAIMRCEKLRRGGGNDLRYGNNPLGWSKVKWTIRSQALEFWWQILLSKFVGAVHRLNVRGSINFYRLA